MKMKRTKEEILTSIAFLQTFSNDNEYKTQLSVLYDYMNDLISLTETYKKQFEVISRLYITKEGNSD